MENVSDRLYDPVGRGDPFGDFTGLDQNVVQVVSDTKIKFEDVAGNEEAKLELKEVVKF
jgi:ATP-dependent Zn protease